jgi:glycogen synthase
VSEGFLMSFRIFYAAGPGDIIGAHNNWKEGKDDPTQMSITYSGQFEDLCQDLDATAYLVSSNCNQRLLQDGRFTFEHRPKRTLGGGLLYHLSEILYGLSLLMTALRFRANLAMISSGTTHYFLLSLFRLFGIRVINVLHNTLWPKGHPPMRLGQRTVTWLDGLYFRWISSASIGISAECTRQVAELSGRSSRFLYVMHPQFRREHFQTIHPAPPLDHRPFNIVFAGRVESNKGVFDILEIARHLQEKAPSRIHWDICGVGADLDELIHRNKKMQLQSVVSIHGWTSPVELREIQGKSHLSIVPTRSSFAEGMAKTAIEAVLAGRPVLTSSVTPALDLLRSASIEARTDHVGSYVDAILALIDDERRYLNLVEASRNLQEQFYGGEKGFRTVSKRAIVELIRSKLLSPGSSALN